MTTPRYDVYALRYATVDRRASENFLQPVEPDAPMPMDYFVWLVRGGGRVFVVDTGFAQEAADRRGRRLLRSPAEALALLDVRTAAVEDVIITHLHYDHAGNLGLFENARLHVQEEEMAYATGPRMLDDRRRHAFESADVSAMLHRLYAGRVVFHRGEATLAPGLSVHRIGGHTRGLQVVRVATRRGWVVLASDAAHFGANIRRRNPFPVFDDLDAMLAGYDRVEGLASSPAHVIPGHDPEVLRLYPAWHDGKSEVVCLHEPPGRRDRGER